MEKDVEVAERGSFSNEDYYDPPPAPLIDTEELTKWSFYRALIAEFIATFLFLYVTVLTVIGYSIQTDVKAGGDECGGVGILGIAWAFGGMIFDLVCCTAGISAVTFGLLLARKVSLVRAVMYMVSQSLGAICGVGLVKAFQSSYFDRYGGANFLHDGYNTSVGIAIPFVPSSLIQPPSNSSFFQHHQFTVTHLLLTNLIISPPSSSTYYLRPISLHRSASYSLPISFVLPAAVTARVSIEAGTKFGWEKIVGSKGKAIGIDRFGASAPAGKIYKEFGITKEAVIAAAKEVL
ncbi:hypothetical protein RYX36_002110 [Vicia faba]